MLGKVYSSINFLKNALDGTWVRNEAISNNIANVNTPGYKKVTVEFENMLKGQTINKFGLNVTNENHIGSNAGSFEPLVKKNQGTSTRRDGNNVNIDTEMSELAQNTIMYNALINQISRKFKQVKNIISEGGK